MKFFIVFSLALVASIQCVPSMVNTGQSAVSRSDDVSVFLWMCLCFLFRFFVIELLIDFSRAMAIMHLDTMKIMLQVVHFEKKMVVPVIKPVHTVFAMLMAVCV